MSALGRQSPRWAFEVAGMQPDDELVDLFPGTGAITDAWNAWRAAVQENNCAKAVLRPEGWEP
jgi:hypothetical protein